MNKEYMQVLIDKCSIFKMSISKFETQSFDNDKVSLLFVNNQQSENYNELQLIKLQINNARNIAKITAVDSVGAHKFSERQANGIPINFLCVWVPKFN